MRALPAAALTGLLAAALSAPGLVSAQEEADAGGEADARGEALYLKWCAECHGAEGAGDGPAAEYMLPRPRDFTQARYQVRTTGSGELPTDADLMRILEEGLPGTTMPGWPNLTTGEREDLVAHLKTFSPFFEGVTPEPMTFSSDPGGGEEALASGRRAYETLECDRCHGEAGRGDGPSAPTLEDWRELPIRAADLTEPWRFNGGTSVEAIHTRILTGLDGTPMPAAIDAMSSGVVSEQEVWHLARYVRSLAPTVSPRVREVVRVGRTEGELPSGPDDPAWEEAEAFWFPLVGQVIETPRNFAPMVDGVWVEGVHDGETLALRLRWHDPSESPDSAWTEWQEKVAAALYADGAEVPTTPLPDAFWVQLPMELTDGRERPYFLQGDGRRPVELWRWGSDEGVTRTRGRGLGSTEPLDAAGLSGEATWEAGEWRLVLRRPVAPEGDAPGLAIPEGRAVPTAFYAWDGSSGEEGARGSISSWYYLYLEEPRSSTVYLIPLLAVALTGGLGVLAVRRAQRRRA